MNIKYTYRILLLLVTSFLLGVVNTYAAGKFTLVIDAGHGGHDAGAIGRISKEKDINLKTALAFGRLVEQNCSDVRVIYTRKTDVFVTLHGRAEIANKAKADFFISIHTNSLPKGAVARGLETYTLGMHRAADNLDVAKRENSVILVEKDYKQHYEGFDPNSSESYIIFELLQDRNMAKSVEMAKLVQRNVSNIARRPDKGVKQAGFLVLRETSMPSCLVELGFISTPDEEQILNTDARIEEMAQGLYWAFVRYRGGTPKTTPISSPTASANTTQSAPGITKDVSIPTANATPAASVTRSVPPTATEPASPEEPSSSGASTTTPKRVDNPKNEDAPLKEATPAPAVTDAPTFKIQILVADKALSANDKRLKGEAADYYKEGGVLKYTIGASANYNEIYQLRKNILEKFPDCFIIAFRGNEKMNVNEAIREYKANKNKR